MSQIGGYYTLEILVYSLFWEKGKVLKAANFNVRYKNNYAYKP